MKWLKLIYLFFPALVILCFGIVYGRAQSAPDGPLTSDYIRDIAWPDNCADARDYCDMMTRFLKTADYLGGGEKTAQLLWFGIPGLLGLWLLLPKPSLAQLSLELFPEKVEADQSKDGAR